MIELLLKQYKEGIMQTRVTELLNIKYPIFQGRMAWVADEWPLVQFLKREVLALVCHQKEVVKANIDN